MRYLLNDNDLPSASKFIGFVHKHLQQRAFYFLKRLKAAYPDKKEVIAFCHYYFGKNLIEAEIPNYTNSRIEFNQAKKIFTELNHNEGLVLINDALLEIKKRQTMTQDNKSKHIHHA